MKSAILLVCVVACVRLAVGQVKCDDSSECPTGNTCCKLASGDWGCCPLPRAVCCSDHIHCCPHGYTCDVSQGKCNKGDSIFIPWIEKVLANRTSCQRFRNSSVCMTVKPMPTTATIFGKKIDLLERLVF